ncbi:MAG: prokaryotic protein [Paenibacillaceae bacterium]|nr:prokaryotic protein [Paenibacillaceae bacterium]
MKTIEITDNIYSDIVGHCRREWPKEACGALFGETVNETTMRITGSLALANVARDPHHHFQIDPREWISLLSRIGALDIHRTDDSSGNRTDHPKLAGIYHSHPETPGVPSSEDLDTAWRQLPCFLIVSLQNPYDPSIRAFGFDLSPLKFNEYEIIKL